MGGPERARQTPHLLPISITTKCQHEKRKLIADVITLHCLGCAPWSHEVYGEKGIEGGGNPELLFILVRLGLPFNFSESPAYVESGLLFAGSQTLKLEAPAAGYFVTILWVDIREGLSWQACLWTMWKQARSCPSSEGLPSRPGR